MPVYEYKCTSCGAREEHILLFSDPPPARCAVCGGQLKRAWSGRVHVALDGWGFSKTDSLLPERRRRGKDFKQLRDKAREISES